MTDKIEPTYEEWTEDELLELLDFRPVSGLEVIEQGLTGLLEGQGITDSVEWVKEIRKKEK